MRSHMKGYNTLYTFSRKNALTMKTEKKKSQGREELISTFI